MHHFFPKLNEEHEIIKETARNFAEKYLLPSVIERDETQTFPQKEIEEMGKLGFMGMMVAEKYGGSGLDTVSYVLAIEEISKVDAAAAVCMSVNNSLVCWGIEEYGTEVQKEKYLKPLASGKILGAFCLSEPSSGSDAAQQHTIAPRQGEYYILNGTKNWITNGNTASVYIVFAQSSPEKRHKGINAFLVERNTSGLTVGKKEHKMGIRSSDTHSIMLEDVRIAKENRLGEEGEGFNIAMNTLNGGRIGIAAQASGIASGAYQRALNYSKERKSFENALHNHQIIQFKLADMATKAQAAHLLCLRAAFTKDQNQPYQADSALAKLYASKIALEVANEAVQIHGGYGYVKEFHVERMMRDAKITQIYEGTSEIQKIVLSRKILSDLKN